VKKLNLPAVSHEMKFVAHHWEEIAEVIDDDDEDEQVLELTKRVEKLADDDAKLFLSRLYGVLEVAAKGKVRLQEMRWNNNEWDAWGRVFVKGRRVRVGYIGLTIGDDFQLIGYARVRPGGLDVQQKFLDKCRKRKSFRKFRLAVPPAFPGWTEEVIWFEMKLTPGQSYDRLAATLRATARKFCTTARSSFENAPRS
jgi:hypothetical protein